MQLRPLLLIPILLILSLLQGTFFAYIPIGDIYLQATVAFVIAWGLWAEPVESLTVAFVAGLLIDLLSAAPIGSSSIGLMLGLLAIQPFRILLRNSRLVLPIVLAIGAMLTFRLAALLFQRIAGYPTSAEMWRNLPATVILHALVALPQYWLLRIISASSRASSSRQINF
jgi:rod shape-determining protein MreD